MSAAKRCAEKICSGGKLARVLDRGGVSSVLGTQAQSAIGDLPGQTVLLLAFDEAGSNGRWAREVAMGLEVGGYEERPDWPKMGPSLLIATWRTWLRESREDTRGWALQRFRESGQTHFATFCCYHRRLPLAPTSKQTCEMALERGRREDCVQHCPTQA